jgi:hypothetical protein
VVTRTVTAPREISPINRTRPRGGSQLRSNHRTVRDCRHLRESFQPAHRLPGRRAVIASNSRIGLAAGSAINLHQLFSPLLTRNFHIAAAPTTRAMAGACREPIPARRTVARNPSRTRRNCRGAQRSAWRLRVAGGTCCRPFVVRQRPVIGKAATARTIVLVFWHPGSPGRRSSAVLENGPLALLACGPADPLLA